MKQSKYLFELVLISIFTLLGYPFLLNTYIGPEISYVIRGLVFVLLIGANKESMRLSSKVSVVLIGLFLYFLIELIVNTEYVFYTLLTIFDILFFIVLLNILSRNKSLRTRVFLWEHNFSLFVSVMIIAAHFTYMFAPGLFYYTDDFAGYNGFVNPILGIINDDKMRPCWYFAEPSFSGFFLGINFFISLKHNYSSKKRRLFELLLLLSGVFITSSTGTYVYLIASLIVLFGQKFKISKSVVQLGLYSAIIFSLFVIPQMEYYGVFTMAVERNEASFLSRQERMDVAQETIDSMSFLDAITGKGTSYVYLKHGKGLADAYYKLYIEYGLLFMLPFLLFVRKYTIKNLPLHCFIMLSFLSVVTCLAPIILICYYYIDIDSKENNYLPC